jgi:hypothetical protein
MAIRRTAADNRLLHRRNQVLSCNIRQANVPSVYREWTEKGLQFSADGKAIALIRAPNGTGNANIGGDGGVL